MPAETTELRELMALDFVTDELGLYLDTHASDTQAFETFKSFLKLYEEGRQGILSPASGLSASLTSRRQELHLAERPLALGIQRSQGGLNHVRI